MIYRKNVPIETKCKFTLRWTWRDKKSQRRDSNMTELQLQNTTVVDLTVGPFPYRIGNH